MRGGIIFLKEIRITKKVLSPSVLIIGTWIFAILFALIGPKSGVYLRHNVIEATFTTEGLLWIAASITTFLFGVRVANSLLVSINITSPPSISKNHIGYLTRFWRVRFSSVFAIFLFISILPLLLYWTLSATVAAGGISSFISLASSDWHRVGELWLSQKPFAGSRLAYTGLIALSIFSASGLSMYNSILNHEEQRQYKSFRSLLLVLLFGGVAPLMVLPLLISQRILLATAIISIIVVYTFIQSRGVPILYPFIGGILSFCVWSAQEIVRRGFSLGGLVESLRYSLDKFFLYFANDIGNLNRGVAFASDHSYGFQSFRFIFQYLFIQDEAVRLLSPYYTNIDLYLAGGTFTAFGIPYMDFGVFGLLLIFAWGYLAQFYYLQASQSVFAAQIYSLIAASIILSWHTALWSLPLFWFNIFLIYIGAMFWARYYCNGEPEL